jgi:hypothetical protein
MNDKKQKPKVERRTVAKVINVQPPRPTGDLFNPFAEAKAAETDQSPTNHPPPTSQAQATHPVAPERNFARVANSVALEAIPASLFRGESFKTYYALHQRTRAAIVPRRSIRATKAEVMEWADVSHNTLKVHLRHLETAGLVIVHYRRGDRDGMDFEVRIPEERHQPTTDQPPTTRALRPSQNVVTQTSQNVAVVGESQVFDSQRTSGESKTSIKTEQIIDDEAMPLLRARAGRLPKTEAVLLSLLDTLESRTDVSSPDALLAHVLARKLAPRGATAQRRPNDEQFRSSPVAEFSEEELADLRRVEAEIRAELSKT